MFRRFLMIGIPIFFAGSMLFASESITGEKSTKAVIGKPAPDISGRLIDKKLLKMEDLLKNKDKIILVDFWATWCPPCRGEIPHLQEVYEANHKKGLEIVSINVDETSDVIEAFIKKTKMPWYHIRDINRKISKVYQVNSIPAPFLIDQNGILVARGAELRGSNLKKTLDKFIGKLPEKEISSK